MKKLTAILLLVLCCDLTFAEAPPKSDLTLVGWGINSTNLDTFFKNAEYVGFDVLIIWSTDPVFLKRVVSLGQAHHIKIFSCLTPRGIANAWAKKYPQNPFPWQVMSEAETAAASFLTAGRNKYLVPYQWGGEPLMTNEVLIHRIPCFNSIECRDLFKPIIDRIVAIPGLEGIAFDGFGYQNYHSCLCPQCRKQFADYSREHPDISREPANARFYRDALVRYVNDLADYARSQRGDIKTTTHIWPVFSPEPLYGNRLDLDYCGQTAAWYTLWPKEKIAEYSRIISRRAKEHHQRQEGVGMIGYYDRPGEFPIKTADCVDMELTTMIENGCTRIQVCGANDVIQNQDVAEVFRKHFK